VEASFSIIIINRKIMKRQKEIIRLGESGFWQNWVSKLLFTLISVKVWGLVACTWVSTYLLLNPVEDGFSLSGAQWLTFNTTIWALIFGMKEIFRIAEKRDLTEKENLKEQIDSKLEITKLKVQTPSSSSTTFTADGLEIVGNEPDSQA
jgi:hypothetical protein